MKIAVINNNDSGLFHFRRELLAELVSQGHEVFVLCPPGSFINEIELLGVKHVPIPLHRFINPVGDVRLFWNLVRHLKKIKPDIVETITIKPNTFGVLAARMAGVSKIVSLVAGAGEGFADDQTFKQKSVHYAARFLYRQAGRFVDKMWFLNCTVQVK